MDFKCELMKIAKDAEDVSEKIANDLLDAADEVEQILKETSDKKIEKKAALINAGDRIICVNPIQGIFKGRIYIAGDYVEPGLLMVLEEDGTKVGCFRAGRFALDHNAF